MVQQAERQAVQYRETAEEVMKDDTQCMTTVTTATLELGIDIGRLERAFQIDARGGSTQRSSK